MVKIEHFQSFQKRQKRNGRNRLSLQINNETITYTSIAQNGD